MTGGRARRALTLVLLALALAATCGAQAASARRPHLPRSSVGMISYDLSPYQPVTATARRQLGAMRRAGVGMIRRSLDVRAPVTAADAYVLAAARRHIRVLPVLLDSSRFNAGQGPTRGLSPPLRFTAFAHAAAQLVRRYGRRGTLWKSHPRLRPWAVHDWQVWNEPNLPVYWQPKPNPRAYARLVRVTGRAIHRRERRAVVVTAGIPDSRQSKPRSYRQYLRAFLRVHGRRQVDAIGVNVYAPTAGAVRKVLRTYRHMANAHHGRRLKLLITELGWADRGHRNPMVVGRKGQARRIAATYRLIARLRHRYHIAGVFYFQWRDYPVLPGDPRGNTWGYHTGLYTVGGRPKPALRAFKRVVGARRAGRR